MSRSEIIRFLLLKTIGNFFLLFAIFGVIATFGPAVFYEIRFRIQQYQGVKYAIVETQRTSALGQIIKNESNNSASLFAFSGNQTLIPIDTHFSILIPKIGANAQVFANTDPVHADSYLPILKKGVAHSAGSALPGEKGSIFLFAHSTDNFWDVGLYNAIFYLVKDLAVGDDVTLFYNNKRFDYAVTDTKIVNPDDVSILTKSKESASQLLLQTCWPPGTTWKRLVVIAKPT